MSKWILVIMAWWGSNAGQTIVINDLPSYQECVRVYREVASLDPKFNRFQDAANAKCIEVTK